MPDRPERWFADGYEFTSGTVRGVETYEGLFTGTSLLATDMSVPGRDGELPGVSRLSPGGFTLHVWFGARSRSEVEQEWETMLRVVMKRHRLVKWTRHRPDGTVRECFGRVVGRISPTPIGRLGIRAQIEVAIPSGTWQNSGGLADTGQLPILSSGPLIPVNWVDPNPGGKVEESDMPQQGPAGPIVAYQPDGSATYTDGWTFHPTEHLFRRSSTPTGGPMDRYILLGPFNGSTAPMTGLWVQFTGPLTGLMLQCPETGSWARYDQPLAAGQTLTIDGERDLVAAPRVDAFRYKGPYMAELVPPDRYGPTHPPLTRVLATQTGSAATIRVRGRRLYQTM